MENKKIYFDIETVVETTDYDNYSKKEVRAERYCNDIGNLTEKEAYFEKGSIHAEFSKIICISLCLFSELISFVGEEKEILTKFFEYLDLQGEFILVGHNIKNFDIPFVFKRAVINGIKPHKSFIVGHLNKWDIPHVDTIDLRKQTGFMGSGLDIICRSLGIQSPKEEMKGKDVFKTFTNDPDGVEKIVRYCESDVRATKLVHEKIMEIIGRDAFEQKPVQTKPDLISEKQVGYCMSLWSAMKLQDSETIRHEYLKNRYGVESLKELDKVQASELIEAIKDPSFKDQFIKRVEPSGSKPKSNDDDLPF